jgi:Transcription factor WhiB
MTAIPPVASATIVPGDTPPPDLVEALTQLRPRWMLDAACREHDPRLWFPTRGGTSQPAIDICRRCLVLDDCRQWVDDGCYDDDGQHHGNRRRPDGTATRPTAPRQQTQRRKRVALRRGIAPSATIGARKQ